MSSSTSASGPPTTVISGGRRWSRQDLKDLWEYRELLGFLAWRDVAVRYKQTALGVAWAVLQPTLTMVVFTIFFGNLAKVPSGEAPYAVSTYAALVPWTLFTYALTNASQSLVSNTNLITKVWFPRILLPVSATLGGLVDLALSLVLMTGLGLVLGVTPRPLALVAVPGLVLITLVAAIGIGALLSAVNAKYRDVRYTLPFLTQLWLFVTPIAYPSSIVPEQWRTLYSLNPMAGVVEGFRWSMARATDFPSEMVVTSSLTSLLMLVVGLWYFRATERTFADVI